MPRRSVWKLRSRGGSQRSLSVPARAWLRAKHRRRTCSRARCCRCCCRCRRTPGCTRTRICTATSGRPVPWSRSTAAARSRHRRLSWHGADLVGTAIEATSSCGVGGHANYPGNDVYRWHSSNLMWERASLPSEIKTDPLLGQIAIDGVDNAPISSHTYDNNLFLPVADRFMTWGGPPAITAARSSGRWSRTRPRNTRLTGPYLFDPNRADGNKVGGTTGSNVKRVLPASIVGGQMWQNRDIHRWLAGQPLPGTHVHGCTGYARRRRTRRRLRRVGERGRDGPQSLSLSAYESRESGCRSDFEGRCLRGGGGRPDELWLRPGAQAVRAHRQQHHAVPVLGPDHRGPHNPDKSVQVNASIAALQSWMTANSVNIQNCGLEYDPTRGRFVLGAAPA